MVATIEAKGQRAAELHKRLSLASLETAYQKGMNFSRWLESEDPSDGYNDGLDAFERQLKIADIVTRSNPERGFYADEFRSFFESTGEGADAKRVLGIEWMARTYRKVAHARSVLSSDSSTVGSALRPYVDAAQVRAAQLAPAIPINELIALSTSIDSNAYRAMYLNDDAKEVRMVRVGETAEIPGATLTAGERPVDLFKYGRRLDVSYESLRRSPIDTVAFWIARAAIQAEVDKASTILDVIVNGDGNSGTAAEVIDLTDLDSSATAGTLTLRGWLNFKLEFENPYNITHELAQRDVILQQLLLNTGNSNVQLRDLAGVFGGFEPMNPLFRDNVRYGVMSDAPALKVVAIDGRFAIEQVTEIGGTINETKRWVEKQTESLVFTEVEGYAVIDTNAAKILNINA